MVLNLEETLKSAWSSSRFAELLTVEIFDQIFTKLSKFDKKTKSRLLISLLYIPAVKLTPDIIEKIKKLLTLCSNDMDEWVKIVTILVFQRLPAIVTYDSDFTIENHSFVNSLTCVINQLNSLAFNNNDDDETDKNEEEFSLPTDFFPLEYVYLCSNLLPSNYKIASSKIQPHFQLKTKEESMDINAILSNESNIQKNTTTVNQNSISFTSSISQKSSSQNDITKKKVLPGFSKAAAREHTGAAFARRSAVKIVDFDEMERKRKEQEKVMLEKRQLKHKMKQQASSKSKMQPPVQTTKQASGILSSPPATPKTPATPAMSEGGTISATMRALLDEGNKLTSADRVIIEQFLAGAPNPTPELGNIKLILINELKTLINEGTAISVECLKFKIDYETRRWSKVRTKKVLRKKKRPKVTTT